MGEIRTQVRLTNALDEALHRRRRIKKSQMRSMKFDAIVDTGAVRCTLPKRVVKQLGLETRGKRIAEFADGRKRAVGITEPFIVEIMGRDTPEEAMIVGDEVLIAQTALEKMDLLADSTRRRLIPNPAHPRGPVTKIRRRRGV